MLYCYNLYGVKDYLTDLPHGLFYFIVYLYSLLL